jgi:hypothetical protein
MWTVIYIASSLKKAEKIQDRLSEAGFLAKTKATGHGEQYEILVPETELEEVQDTLSEMLH